VQLTAGIGLIAVAIGMLWHFKSTNNGDEVTYLTNTRFVLIPTSILLLLVTGSLMSLTALAP
jgi:hypothetical protein